MAKILAFAGSNSSASINYKLVLHTISMIEDHEIQRMNMAHYPFPMYSMDVERDQGYSNSLIELKNDIQKADGLILAVNEHNGNPSAYFKNVLDWLSRIERKFLEETKVFLMAASPGKRGGVGALEVVGKMLPRFGADVTATFSMPSFQENFDSGSGIKDKALQDEHQKALQTFLSSL